uniref:hypothetical protein n=1 Tax=Halobacteriovorax sp. TaxID=2020862 RepID=UPI003569A050
MKKLSISTFWIFVLCLCLRTYSYLSYSELKDKVQSSESLLNDDKKKTIALLNTLNDLTQNKPKVDNFREVSSKDLESQRRKESTVINFIEDFYASKENLAELSYHQKVIKNINKELNVENAPLEYLDIELLYYFVIRENFDLRDFQKIIIFEDLGFDREAMAKIRKFSVSKEFKIEILRFKNIYTEEVVEPEYLAKESIQIEDNDNNIDDRLMSPEDKVEFLKAANEQEVDLEAKLMELDYTPEEIEEM